MSLPLDKYSGAKSASDYGLACVAIAAGLFVAYSFSLCVYRLYFHPLSRFPGPLIAKITPAYGAYQALSGNLHLDIKACHTRYGSVIRYGPNRLIFNSVQGLNDIYGSNKSIRKGAAYIPMVPWEDGWTVATCVDKTLHRRMRSTLHLGLSHAAIKQFEPCMTSSLERFVQCLAGEESNWSEPRDMSTLVKCLGIDTMSELGFGQRIGLVESPEQRYLVPYFDAYEHRIGLYQEWPALSRLGLEKVALRLFEYLPSARRYREWRESFERRAIDENGETKVGIFSGLVQSGGAKHAYSYSQMMAEGSFTLLVGGGTNASGMAGALFNLAHHPQVMARLASEVRSAFKSADEISLGPALSSCTYLDAVVAETLRHTPPGPGVLWREVDVDVHIIDGVPVPRDTEVGTCVWSIQHEESIFRDAHRFWPERWLSGTLPGPELAVAQAASKPFSMGPRACAGRNVALAQVKLLLARVLWDCEMKLADGELGKVGGGRADAWHPGRRRSDEYQFGSHFTSKGDGPWLQFRFVGFDGSATSRQT